MAPSNSKKSSRRLRVAREFNPSGETEVTPLKCRVECDEIDGINIYSFADELELEHFTNVEEPLPRKVKLFSGFDDHEISANLLRNSFVEFVKKYKAAEDGGFGCGQPSKPTPAVTKDEPIMMEVNDDADPPNSLESATDERPVVVATRPIKSSPAKVESEIAEIITIDDSDDDDVVFLSDPNAPLPKPVRSCLCPNCGKVRRFRDHSLSASDKSTVRSDASAPGGELLMDDVVMITDEDVPEKAPVTVRGSQPKASNLPAPRVSASVFPDSGPKSPKSQETSRQPFPLSAVPMRSVAVTSGIESPPKAPAELPASPPKFVTPPEAESSPKSPEPSRQPLPLSAVPVRRSLAATSGIESSPKAPTDLPAPPPRFATTSEAESSTKSQQRTSELFVELRVPRMNTPVSSRAESVKSQPKPLLQSLAVSAVPMRSLASASSGTVLSPETSAHPVNLPALSKRMLVVDTPERDSAPESQPRASERNVALLAPRMKTSVAGDSAEYFHKSPPRAQLASGKQVLKVSPRFHSVRSTGIDSFASLSSFSSTDPVAPKTQPTVPGTVRLISRETGKSVVLKLNGAKSKMLPPPTKPPLIRGGPVALPQSGAVCGRPHQPARAAGNSSDSETFQPLVVEEATTSVVRDLVEFVCRNELFPTEYPYDCRRSEAPCVLVPCREERCKLGCVCISLAKKTVRRVRCKNVSCIFGCCCRSLPAAYPPKRHVIPRNERKKLIMYPPKTVLTVPPCVANDSGSGIQTGLKMFLPIQKLLGISGGHPDATPKIRCGPTPQPAKAVPRSAPAPAMPAPQPIDSQPCQDSANGLTVTRRFFGREKIPIPERALVCLTPGLGYVPLLETTPRVTLLNPFSPGSTKTFLHIREATEWLNSNLRRLLINGSELRWVVADKSTIEKKALHRLAVDALKTSMCPSSGPATA